MSNTISDISLWLALAWPLLLAIPALHSRLPLPRHIAILPAALLVVMPGDTSQLLPWLLFGTELAIDAETRWILVMSVIIWLVVATVSKASLSVSGHDRSTPLFMLTLAGNLGVILAADLVGFFFFATLMGYGFYGLLVYGGDVASRRAARLYIIFLIIADLALFEALLLAAFMTQELQFSAVRQTTVAEPVYQWLVLAGFVLKAGVWPFHLWLSATFKSAPRSATLLLGGVPVAMALLGLMRWLPLGESDFYGLGTVCQVTGVVALLYGMLRIYIRLEMKKLPAWGLVAATGGGVALLGTGLVHPDFWHQYQSLAYPVIAALGFLSALVVSVIGWLEEHQPAAANVQQVGALSHWAARRGCLVRQSVAKRLAEFQSQVVSFQTQLVALRQGIGQWQSLLDDAERCMRRWPAAITLLLLLAIVVALLAYGS